MKRLPNGKARNPEKGVALIIALLALLIITAVAAGMIAMANTETSISANFKDQQTAFFSARAGVEEIRDRIRSAATNSLSGSLPTVLPGNANGVLYITNPAGSETVAPWNTSGSNYPDNEICKEVTCTSGVPAGTPWYTTASASPSYAATPIMNWKWARVTLKTNQSSAGTVRTSTVDGGTNANLVCWSGTNQKTTANPDCKPQLPVYLLTALGVTPSGSRRMIQYEVASSSFPPPPGAMVFDGPTPTYSAPNSNVLSVVGNDSNLGPNSGAGCGTAINQPAVGAYDAASASTLTAAIPKPANYTGTGGTPSVQNVAPALGPYSTVDGLTNLVSSVTSAAASANVYTGATSALTNSGTVAAPVINVVKGDLTLSGGFSGSGILLVTGTLTMSGNPNYNGLILVIGKGVFNKNGGGNGTTNGSIVVANMFDSLGNPIPLGANNSPGAPTINWNGGGNATIQYDSCWINYVGQQFPYRTLALRELMY